MIQKIQFCISIMNGDNDVLLKTLQDLIDQQDKDLMGGFDLRIFDNTPNSSCWDDKRLVDLLAKDQFSSYVCTRGEGSIITDYNNCIFHTKNQYICFVKIDKNISNDLVINLWNAIQEQNCGAAISKNLKLYKTTSLRKIGGFYKKYIEPSFVSTYKQIENIKQNIYYLEEEEFIENVNHQQDAKLYADRLVHPLYDQHIIYIDTARGDHICAIPMIKEHQKMLDNTYGKGNKKVYICCKTPEIYCPAIIAEEQVVSWLDPLFGEGGWNVYDFGSTHDSPSLVDAFCEMYGVKFETKSFFSYPTNPKDNEAMRNRFALNHGIKPIAVIAPSSAIINGVRSNKEWSEVRWMEIVSYLQSQGFYVVQMWYPTDPVIPTVNEILQNADIKTIVATLAVSNLWISVDSFIHHFGSILGKRGICLTPWNNEHAYHKYNIYIAKKIEGINYTNRWWLDAQQPERKLCMEAITVQEVKEAINVLTNNSHCYRHVANDFLQSNKDTSQIPKEITALQSKVASIAPEIIVEIGTNSGGTLIRWMEISSVKTIISIDLPNGIHGGPGYNFYNNDLKPNVEEAAKNLGIELHMIAGDSHVKTTVEALEKALAGRKIDFLFIDGDHRYPEGCLYDFLDYSSFVKEKGLIAFHDIIDSPWQTNQGAQVNLLWKEIEPIFKSTKHIAPIEEAIAVMPDSAPYGFGGIGVIEMNHSIFNKFKYQKEFAVSRKFVSVIIGNTNNSEFTNKCIRSIANSTSHNNNEVREIIVVDNGTEEYKPYNTHWPEINLIKVKEQLGYGRAYSLGIQHVNREDNKHEIDYVLLLNNDCEVSDNWLDLLVSKFADDPLVKLVGPCYDSEKDYVPGFCSLVKLDVLEEIGLFDFGFSPGYYEDDDLCRRIKNAGYKIAGVDNSSVPDDKGNRTLNFPINHHGMGTFGKMPQQERDEIIFRNKAKYEYLTETKHNLCFVAVTFEGNVLERIKYLHKHCPEAMFLIVFAAYEFTEKINEYKELLKEKNVHAIQACFNGFIKEQNELEELGYKFFSNENKENIFFLYDRVSDDTIPLTWLAMYNDHASMGILSQKYLENFSHKIECGAKNILSDFSDTKNSYIKKLLQQPTSKDLGIMFAYPYVYQNLDEFRNKIIYTGADTDGGMSNNFAKTPDMAEYSNKADILFTPSRVSKQHMIDIGVTKPIFVAPHGVDTHLFQYRRKEKNTSNIDPINFLYVGELGDRKGTFQLLAAWKKAFFHGKNNAHLYLRSNKDMESFWKNELEEMIKGQNNVHLIQQNAGQEDIAIYMHDTHCLIYPSRADTFGMTVLEAMSCGLPVISNDNIGFSDFIPKNLYTQLTSKKVPISYHPWMLGQWLETDVNDLKKQIEDVYEYYSNIKNGTGINYVGRSFNASEFIQQNFTWKKVTSLLEEYIRIIYENRIKKKKIAVCVTSFNRKDYLMKTLDSIFQQQKNEVNYFYEIHIVEQSSIENKKDILTELYEKYGDSIIVHNVYTNLGQKGALNKLYDEKVFNDVEYICMTDHDNIFHKPISLYCKILDSYNDCWISTGYLNREHAMNDCVVSEFGTLVIKSTCRAGHMVMRQKDLLSMMPMYLDSQYTKPHNASWNMGLDWELIAWNPKSPLARGIAKTIYCLPGGVEHVGSSSTWNPNENILDFEVPVDEGYWISQQTSPEIIERVFPEKH